MATEQKPPFAPNFAAMPAMFATYQTKLVEITQANSVAAFRYIGELAKCKTPAECAQVTQEHIKQQFEAFQRDAKELMSIAQEETRT